MTQKLDPQKELVLFNLSKVYKTCKLYAIITKLASTCKIQFGL